MSAPDPGDLPLRDIHLPDAVSWWPPAPGWWLLLALLIIAILGGVAWWRWRRRRRILVALQRELQTIRNDFDRQGDAATTLHSVSALLRRAGISLFPRREVASLTGKDWTDFLNAHTNRLFDDDHRSLLTETGYRQSQHIDNAAVTRLLPVIERALPLLFRNARRLP